MSVSDSIQGQALVKLLELYGWTSISVLMSSFDYGRNALSKFLSDVIIRKWHVESVQLFQAAPDPADIDARLQLRVIRDSGKSRGASSDQTRDCISFRACVVFC